MATSVHKESNKVIASFKNNTRNPNSAGLLGRSATLERVSDICGVQCLQKSRRISPKAREHVGSLPTSTDIPDLSLCCTLRNSSLKSGSQVFVYLVVLVHVPAWWASTSNTLVSGSHGRLGIISKWSRDISKSFKHDATENRQIRQTRVGDKCGRSNLL